MYSMSALFLGAHSLWDAVVRAGRRRRSESRRRRSSGRLHRRLPESAGARTAWRPAMADGESGPTGGRFGRQPSPVDNRSEGCGG
ncbi:hypothetical protein HMPREF0972_00302 [Actinomyces sp. oral taxon 848 str. F0332]|nr:hypothetical protein HMPREF0972_00302 [Actinomyces sp. oral taxon 848 str. F0332]